MTNKLDRLLELCTIYGHKSKNVFKIEFNEINSLKKEIEQSLENVNACGNLIAQVNDLLNENTQLKEKLEKIKEHCNSIIEMDCYNVTDNICVREAKKFKKILEEKNNNFKIDPALQAKLDAKKKFQEEDSDGR